MLSQRDQLIRSDVAQISMTPTYQRLYAHYLVGDDGALGLVVNFELVAVQRPPQISHQRQLSGAHLLVFGRIQLHRRLSLLLGGVHGHIGSAQEKVTGTAMQRSQRHADGHSHRYVDGVELDDCADGVEDRLRHRSGRPAPTNVGQ